MNWLRRFLRRRYAESQALKQFGELVRLGNMNKLSALLRSSGMIYEASKLDLLLELAKDV